MKHAIEYQIYVLPFLTLKLPKGISMQSVLQLLVMS